MLPKQRGVYSEILVTEDNEELKKRSTTGPSKDNIIKANLVQKVPRATGIKRREKLINAQSAIVDTKTKILGKSYFRNPDVNTGYYSKKREGVADVDPKVLEPYIPLKDHPPRKVIIDRQKKLFASLNIEELLLELGVDYSIPPKQAAESWASPFNVPNLSAQVASCKLPLEPFDDSEYDCRTPEEWIECGNQMDEKFEPIPGQSLWRDENGVGHWRRVLIYKHDQERDMFEGTWDNTTKKCEVARVNLLFDAEDPRIFAQRVAKAHRDRMYADSQIRYNFILSFMPTDELQELDSEQTNRIQHMANRQNSLDGGNLSNMMSEVSKNYSRTMNKEILHKSIFEKKPEDENTKELINVDLKFPTQSSDIEYKSSLTEGVENKFNKECPYFAMIPIPAHDFPKKFSDFCFNSLYIKQEVIEAMVKIRTSCNDLIINKRLFDCSKDKTIRLEEFKQIQNSANAQMKYATGEQWVNKTLCKIINDSFASIGKGWFNIHDTSKETYEFGKLKRFLTTVNFMMQDSVLSICEMSVKEFEDFILKFVPLSTEVKTSNIVENIFPKKAEEKKEKEGEGEHDQELSDDDVSEDSIVLEDEDKDPNPLFLLDLVLKPGHEIPQYSTDPKEVVNTVMGIFEDGIKVLQEIPQLEPILLKHLFLKNTHGNKSLKAPLIPLSEPKIPERKHILPDENTWLWNASQKIRNSLLSAVGPLKEYLKTFEKFIPESQLNVEKYILGLNDFDNPASVDEIKMDIAKHRKEVLRLEQEIPESVNVSYFKVNCKEIRKLFVGKHSSIVEKEIKQIANRARDMNSELSLHFEEMESKIRKVPSTIEELTDIKDYMAALPIEIQKNKVEIQDCMGIYDMLEDYQYDFSMNDMDSKWELFSAPKKLMETIQLQTSTLDKQKEVFLKEMAHEQEEFEEMLDGIEETVGGFAQYDDMSKFEELYIDVQSVNARLNEYTEKTTKFNRREALMGKPMTDYSKLRKACKDFEPYSNLWTTARNWEHSHKSWLEDPWEQLNAQELEDTVQNSFKVILRTVNFFKSKDQQKILDIANTVKDQIDGFRKYVPLAVALRKEGMYERHWDQVSEGVGFDIRPTENFTFTTVIEKGLEKHIPLCEEVGEKASREYTIESLLKKMQEDWNGVCFMTPQFKSTPTFYISGFDEAMNMLDEHIVTTQTMQFSPFRGPFEEDIIKWNEKLLLVSDTLEEWIKCQGQWMYLQPIFDSPDIMKQLPQETKRFKSVDSTWKHIMNQTNQTPNILLSCSKEGLLEKFTEANKNLEIVQKGLAEYLERKRSIFARFYFLSNDELLEILSQTKEVRNVRPHLRKVFENMADLEFKDDDTIHSMYSAEGENVGFVKKVDPRDKNVENWMGDVEKMMINSVRAAFLNSVEDYKERKRIEWVLSHPGQCVLNGSQVHWTIEVEESIKAKGIEGIKEYYTFLCNQLDDTVTLVRQQLSKMQTITMNALIVIDVHARDVVDTLKKQGVDNIGAFEWIMQLRYYWENDDVFVKCIQTNFPYGYEYLGNTLRLVITPLTDKCYMTLMGALKLNLGGAPAGPAGTGKTESTKDLAKALAKQCVVFNCSDGMDHIMVGKFFKGLASAGAWACFDEFNRINIEVLSVIAQQLLILFGAKENNEPELEFEESLIKMKPTFSVFITMNPGYAGRTELPDNLKALFRPVAMMVPDYALIGEIMLYSFGFKNGKPLARKMVTTFKLSSEQLSYQDHYDYGMRAVRSVINAAGLLKRAHPDMDEDQLLLRALRDVNVPKFLKDDLPLFENIILDLFPGVKRPEQEYGKLTPSINKSCEKYKLQPVEPFLAKIIQLYDTIQVRHGLMIVGPTGGGKTMNYKVLSDAISALKNEEDFEKVNVHVINPKSITMGQLYGYVDPQTTEWVDGVVAKMVNDCAKDQSPEKHWIMFDGPVDALWIESMNTVLDDNKKLCLNSGQIIALSERMTMMFEVEDLAVASPATVSRCGMVYMEPEALTLNPLIKSWLQSLPPKIQENKNIMETLNKIFDSIMDDACYYLRKNCIEPVTTVDNNLCQSSFRILNSYFKKYLDTEIKIVDESEIEDLESMIKELTAYALVWSIGCTTNSDGRKRMDAFLRNKFSENKINFPKEKTVYDWCYNIKNKEWVPWLDTIPNYNCDTKMNYTEIVVPTDDSVRMKYLMKHLIMNNQHVLTPGPTGVGKTVNISQLLSSEVPEEIQFLAMTFSAQTSANQTQDYLDDKFQKRRKGVYGPPAGNKFVIFIDDLNMPKKEEYGAQPPLELLRQWLDHKGWYDRKSKEKPFMNVVDIMYTCSMGPPGGGRSPITQRLQRHFNIITYTDLEQNTIHGIFLAIVQAFLANFSEDIKKNVESLVEVQLKVYNSILTGPLKPIPRKSHYTFNLRDISKIFQGICSVNNQAVAAKIELIRLWVHENKRVFGDRLIDQTDRDWLDDELFKGAEEYFEAEKSEIFNTPRIVFGDFMHGLDVEPRSYEQIINLPQFQEKIREYLENYNDGVKNKMRLVMFLDACDHVARISRCIRQPLGNAFCLGVGGSGRQSLSRLASFICNYKMFQIEVVKGYNMQNWREDIKKVLLQCGAENKPTTFLFCDTQIINEQMLEDINGVLNSADVPNLYKKEDFELIMEVGEKECLSRGIAPTTMNRFSSYVNRVRSNVHMVIAMSPLGEVFRNRIRMFPSLVNCCTLDWFTEWPEEALREVATGDMEESDINLDNMLGDCVEVFVYMHQTVEMKSDQFLDELRRYNYVTPTSYLELLNVYRSVFFNKQKEITFLKERLNKGLKVLADASVEIDKLKDMLDKKQPELEKTKAEVAETKEQLASDKAEADEERAIVAEKEAKATEQESEANALKDAAESELSKAAPLLEEATRVLKELKVEDLYILGSFNNPTGTVVIGMELSCVMMGLKPKKNLPKRAANDIAGFFDCAKSNLLNNPKNFREKMINYDKDNIPEAIVKRANTILESPDFTLEKVKSASGALVAIHKWVSAMISYHQLLKIVNPKRAKVAEMKEQLAIVSADLAEKRQQLKEVDERIEELERMFREKINQEDALTKEIDECNKKLERAGKLISGLQGEKIRWTNTVKQYEAEYGLLVGNCLIAAGMVAYAGPFTSKYRSELEELWRIRIDERKIPCEKGITMMGLLEDKVKTKLWTASGLPNDNLSIENAIIMFKSRRWSLMIDPQNQANKFVKKLGAEECEVGLDVMKTSNPNLLRNLELGIQTGKWVMIENVGQELDPALEPILLQQKTKSGGGWTLKLGDKVIAYDDNFRFFMTTTIPNPHYSPETSVKVTLLNFAITPFGLEEQMLNQFVLQEMPDLQKRKDMIVQQNAQAAKTLREIEDKILQGLTKNSEISAILEDDELINILADSKQTSDDINQRLIESEETEKEIDMIRESYRIVAFRASLLFFCIIDLAYIDPMYQYSLQWFSHLFGTAIDSSPKAEGVEERSKILNDFFTQILYENICRSLFERHKIQFSFLLTIKILFGDNKIDPLEWRYYLAGPTGDCDVPANPTSWLGELEWAEVYKQIYGTRDLENYKGFLEYFMKEHAQFKRIFDSKDPEVEALPGEWDNKLDSFQKMIVLKAIRADKISEAISNFIVEKIGEEFIIPPTFDLAKSFKDSSVTSPLIFVLSAGSDPVSDYLRFANEQNMMSKQASISLGKGQDKKAEKLIEEAASRGGWVLLMNCHLATSFMPKLEIIVENLDDSNHRDFRMWLTSMPNKDFPVSVLQNSVKMTLEPPKGLRSNLLRSYAAFDERELNEGTTKPEAYKKLLFAYCFFHAIVQDRRKFGPIGWNIAYEFTNEDLSANLKQLKIFLDEYEDIPFKVLHFLGAVINYGGRVTDDKDERLINTILEVYIKPDILDDNYRFSESGKYFVPPNGDIEDYQDYIKSLPLKPNPEVFGLHENAEITTAQMETRNILETILTIQPRASAGAGKTREEIIQELSEGIQKRTPPCFDLEMVGNQYPTEYTESMNTVLFQECVRYNKMLAIMHESLINIQKAIVGEVVMSEDLEKMGDSLFNNQVPHMWSEFGFLSLKPLGSWVTDMNDRIEFLTKWIEGGTPSVFWISGFFFPQAFFTGTLQNYARKHVIAVDQLDFAFNYMDTVTYKDLTDKPEDGCYIYGMYIEGCRWDYENHMLAESLPKMLYTDLPCIHFMPIANKVIKEEGIYNCPVYKVLSRQGTLSTTGHSTNFVLFLEIPTDQKENKWIRAGVAVFLALRY